MSNKRRNRQAGARAQGEHHLFILWEHARPQADRILADLKQRFTVRAVFGIQWTPDRVASNFTRFYGENLPPGSFKEVHCGAGRFLAVIVRDEKPAYDLRSTSKGERRVNTRTFDAKQQYREWTGGGHRVHATDSEVEARHDLAMLFGLAVDELLRRLPDQWSGKAQDIDADLVGAAGWKDLKQLFAVLADAQSYVVLRNFDELPTQYRSALHGDIDLLTPSAAETAFICNARKVFPESYRVHYVACIAGEDVFFDFRQVGDDYYCRPWEEEILALRVLHPGGFFTPSVDHHFYSLLYHALVHKPNLAPDYAARLGEMALKLGEAPGRCQGLAMSAAFGRELLSGFLSKNGWQVTAPLDRSVYFNADLWSDIRRVAPSSMPDGQDAVGQGSYVDPVVALIDSVEDLGSNADGLAQACLRSGLSPTIGPFASNLLRPLESSLRSKRVALMGPTTSGLARWLGEVATELTIETTDEVTAEHVQAHCRGLDGVRLTDDITLADPVDAAIIVASPEPHLMARMLKCARSWVSAGAFVAIVARNRLPALLGAELVKEGEPDIGAFGRDELSQVIASHGLVNPSVWHVWPSLVSPALLLDERVNQADSRDLLRNLLSSQGLQALNCPVSKIGSWSQALGGFIDEGMAGVVAPGFVFSLGKEMHASAVGVPSVYAWANGRRMSHRVELTLQQVSSGWIARRRMLGVGRPPEGMCLAVEEPVLPGQLLFNSLVELVNRAGWSTADLVTWIAPLEKRLGSHVDGESPHGPTLPGRFFDATPFNFIGEDGRWALFDLEFVPDKQVSLDQVLFRGLLHSLIRVGSMAPPTSDTPRTAAELAAKVVERLGGRPVPQARWLQYEAEFQSRVGLLPSLADHLVWPLPVRETGHRRSVAAPKATQQGPAIPRLAAVLHLFYDDLWAETLQYLRRLPSGVQLFVTAPRNRLSWVRRIVTTDWPAAIVVGVANVGRDVGALASLLRQHDLGGYDLVLKIHTKRSPHLPMPEAHRWRRALFDGLLPEAGVDACVAAMLRMPSAGIFGPREWLFEESRDPGRDANRESMQRWAGRLGLPEGRAGDSFVAGTMFWARGEVMAAFAALRLQDSDFEAEGGQLDGTLAHTLERLMPRIAASVDMTVVGVPGEPGARRDDIGTPLRRWLGAIDRTDAQRGAVIDRLGGKNPSLHLRVIVLAGPDESQESDLTLASLDQAGAACPGVEVTLIGPHKRPDVGRCQHVEAGPQELAEAMNRVVAGCRQEWLLVLRAGECLTQDGLATVALELAGAEQVRFVFADELIGSGGGVEGVVLRPAFNLDLLLSFPAALARHALIRREVWMGLGGVDPSLPKALEFDLLLRAIAADGVAGIGHVASPMVSAPAPASQSNGDEIEALRRHLSARGYADATVRESGPRHYQIDYGHAAQPLVSIIVPTRDQISLLRRCIESLLETTGYPNYEILIVDNDSRDEEACAWLDGVAAMDDERIRVIRFRQPFNFSAMNNLAANEARGEYLVLLNNDTAIVEADWLAALLNHAQRPEVGIVGAKLLYPDGKVQHAGVVLGLRGPAEHVFVGEALDAPGYMDRLQLDQNYSAVTAACMMVRKSVFLEVGGMDEQAFAVSYNDIDLCLKVGRLGLLTVWTPRAIVVHEGSVSQRTLDEDAQEAKRRRFLAEQEAMYDKWLPQLAFDPAYNPRLSLSGFGFELETLAELTARKLPWRPVPLVLAHPADRFGCGHYRLMQPLRAMHLAGHAETACVERLLTPPELARMDPDVIVLQRQIGAAQLDAMQLVRKFARAFLVFELDDYLPNLPMSSAFRRHIPKDALKSLRRALGMVDRLVVSTDALAEAFDGFHADTKVVKNRLPLSWWGDLQSSRRRGARPRVGWAGGAGHAGDLALIVDVVKELAGEVEWVFFGMCPDALLEVVDEVHAAVAIEGYPRKLAELDLDLALAPLEDNLFNRCKSNLRLIEYGACGVPVIASDIRCYRDDALPVTLVKNRFKDWVDAIRAHVRDLDAAARAGDTLRETVRRDWLLDEAAAKAWLEAWSP